MKNLLFTFLFSSISLFAQEKLVVEYENRTEVDLSKETDPQMIKILKAANDFKSNYQLITTKEESSFKEIERLDNSQKADGIQISFHNLNKNLYKNFKNNQSLTFEDYNGKLFIIEDSLIIQPWILQREKSTFLGYEVKRATFENNGATYEAWYAPKLAYKNGPDKFTGLPGIILKLIITENDAIPTEKTYYTATKVEINDKAKIEKPTKGELISRKDYDIFSAEQYEKFKKMQSEKIDKKID